MTIARTHPDRAARSRRSRRVAIGFLAIATSCSRADRDAPGPAAAAEPESRLRELPLPSSPSDRASFRFARIVSGAAELALFVRGAGEATITFHLEGDAPDAAVERHVALARASATSPCKCAIPGEGSRAVSIEIAAPTDTEWKRIVLRDVEPSLRDVGPSLRDAGPRPPPTTTLAGALRGRSLVVVVADALNAAHLGCYGATRPTSPAIDALAREGVRFASARSQTAWTIPSVATLFTGLAQEQHGVRDVGQSLDESVPTLAERFLAAGYATAAFLQNGLVSRATGLDRGFDTWRECTGDARDSLKEQLGEFLATPRTQPLFLYVHLLPPHAPYTPPAPFDERFVAKGGAIDGSIAAMRALNQQKPAMDSPAARQMTAHYDNNVAYADELVRALRETATARLGKEKLALLFLSDHGEGMAEHGFIGHNVHVFEEAVHVPMILVAAGSPIPAGATVSTPVFLPDLLPSLEELFGLGNGFGAPEATDAGANRGRPGSSIAGLIERANGSSTGDPRRSDEGARLLRLSARYVKDQPLQRALVLGEFKLVAPCGQEPAVLFDLAHDPGERTDCAAAHPILFAALREELAAWQSERAHRASAASTDPDARLRKELRELGYTEDGGK